ncbi:hypothetical protein CKA32_006356 [Geitlerinema sp. FC II]|nr:hypothetical protein CKA32_006356 [Geitlerinema sp. FC II]
MTHTAQKRTPAMLRDDGNALSRGYYLSTGRSISIVEKSVKNSVMTPLAFIMEFTRKTRRR